MARSERRACPACGTLRCVACNGVHKAGVSRFYDHKKDHPQHNVIMVPVVHRHAMKAEDHEEFAQLWAAKGHEVFFPLQGYAYPAGSSKDS